MTKEEKLLKNEFETAHPELVKLNPEINVCTVIEEWDEELDQLVNPNRMEISVNHSFIFDNRLIPSKFKEIKVNNIIVGEPYPKEFFENIEEGIEIPLHVLEDPDKYINYVTKHIDSIRQRLYSPDMSIDEALDAITGDFNKHKIWFKNILVGDI